MKTIAIAENPLRLVLQEGSKTTLLPALWVRTRSRDPQERDPVTQQRLVNPHEFPADLTLTKATKEGAFLALGFSDGFSGTFLIDDLLLDTSFSDDCPAAQAWDASSAPVTWYQWDEVVGDKKVFLETLDHFIRYGFLLLRNTGSADKTVLKIAQTFGFPRVTNFGALFDVRTLPENNSETSDDLAYRSVALGPHTDNPYRAPIPGIQLLHCLHNETSGGLSTLVDSLTVCALLKQEDPAGYDLLCSVPIRYSYYSGGAILKSVAPLIECDAEGNLLGILYSPRLDDIPLMSDSDTRKYQAARKRMSQLLNSPAHELRFRLASGECMMFDNNRVLHGRTSFNPNEGLRHLQGCYIDRDTPRSHYRILNKSL